MRGPSPAGAANSTNSKPLMPIGFSKVVTSMPRLGPWDWVCMFMGENSVDWAGAANAAGKLSGPVVIVSAETICKAHRSMTQPDGKVRAAPGEAGGAHEVLELEHFLPYRLSVVSNHISQTIANAYAERFGISITEWRVLAVLGRYPALSANGVAERPATDQVAASRARARPHQTGVNRRETPPRDPRPSAPPPRHRG